MALSDFFNRDSESQGSSHIKDVKDRFHKLRRPLEEPTFLGFKVLFDFVGAGYSPLFNLTNDSIPQSDAFQDQARNAIPGRLGLGNNEELDNSKVSPDDNLDSAEEFLIMNGYAEKASYLKAFVAQLRDLSLNSEWYFKSISGLQSAITADYTDNKVMGGNGEELISIEVDETLDMKISTMLYNYYTAIYDRKNRREVLPENLKYFNMHVYIADFRDFVAYDNRLSGGYGQTFNIEDIERGFGKSDVRTIEIPQLVLSFNNCYIDPIGFGEAFNEISNSEPSQFNQKIDIRYNGLVEHNIKDLFSQGVISSESDKSVVDSKIGSIADRAAELAAKSEAFDEQELSNQLATLGSRLAGQGLGVINNNIEKVRGRFRDVILGNVYGGTTGNNAPQQLLNAALNSIRS